MILKIEPVEILETSAQELQKRTTLSSCFVLQSLCSFIIHTPPQSHCPNVVLTVCSMACVCVWKWGGLRGRIWGWPLALWAPPVPVPTQEHVRNMWCSRFSTHTHTHTQCRMLKNRCTLAHTHKHTKMANRWRCNLLPGLKRNRVLVLGPARLAEALWLVPRAAVDSHSPRRHFECCLQPGAVSNSNKQRRRILSRCRTCWPKETKWCWSSSQSSQLLKWWGILRPEPKSPAEKEKKRHILWFLTANATNTFG